MSIHLTSPLLTINLWISVLSFFTRRGIYDYWNDCTEERGVNNHSPHRKPGKCEKKKTYIFVSSIAFHPIFCLIPGAAFVFSLLPPHLPFTLFPVAELFFRGRLPVGHAQRPIRWKEIHASGDRWIKQVGPERKACRIKAWKRDPMFYAPLSNQRLGSAPIDSIPIVGLFEFLLWYFWIFFLFFFVLFSLFSGNEDRDRIEEVRVDIVFYLSRIIVEKSTIVVSIIRMEVIGIHSAPLCCNRINIKTCNVISKI